MRTNGTRIVVEPELEEEVLNAHTTDHVQPLPSWERTPSTRRAPDNQAPDAGHLRPSGGADRAGVAEGFVLAQLADKIGFSISGGLVMVLEELEHYFASETRKVGDAVERRFDRLQISLDEVSGFIEEQRSTNVAVQDQLQQLTMAVVGLRETDARQTAEMEILRTEAREFSASVSKQIDISTTSLQESDVRQWSELEALRMETKAFSISVSERIAGLCADLGVQQEDVAALKTTLPTLGSRVDALVERLDRQADTVRLMHTNYSQRETELEQLVNGIARLKAFATPLPTGGL